jgi:hypothetical protein
MHFLSLSSPTSSTQIGFTTELSDCAVYNYNRSPTRDFLQNRNRVVDLELLWLEVAHFLASWCPIIAHNNDPAQNSVSRRAMNSN